MSLCLKKSLLKLARLSADCLHHTAVRIRKALAGAEWKMGVCLLAMSREKRYLERGFSSVFEYAENSLKLGRKKTYLLLATARALEHLPLASVAYQVGELCWSKMRALQSVLTPETEVEWLKFALDRSAHEVSRAVAFSPTAWKSQLALEASKAAAPIATAEAVREIVTRSTVKVQDPPVPDALSVPPPVEGSELVPQRDKITSGGARAVGKFVKPTIADLAPKKIRLIVEMTPEQYSIFQAAQRHARARIGGRTNVAQVLVHMSEHLLDSGTARTRAKHQIVIHTTPEQEQGWYQTDRGPLPVSAEILSQAKGVQSASAGHATRPHHKTKPSRGTKQIPGGQLSRASGSSHETKLEHPTEPSHGPESRTATKPKSEKKSGTWRRKDIPLSTLRAVFKRAEHCCQRCGEGAVPLQIHHKHPLSEGGTDDLETLELLCCNCHSGHHEKDFLAKPHWAAARSKAIKTAEVDPCF